METKCSVSNERHTSLADTLPFSPFSSFSEHIFLLHAFAEEKKKRQLSIRAPDITDCACECMFRPQFILDGEYNCFKGEPKTLLINSVGPAGQAV